MNRTIKLTAVGFVLFVELIFVLMHNPYPHGDIVDIHYRQKERMDALWNYNKNKTPETKTAFDVELKKMHSYELAVGLLKLTALIAINGIVIYMFLDSAKKEDDGLNY